MWNARDLWIPPEKRDWYEGGPTLYRKRFRHARRYYRRLRRQAETLQVNVHSWFDYWHTHADWRGDGNRGARHRRRHLEASFIMYRRLLEQARHAPGPMDVFMIIHAYDSANDAVYVHTPNPNRDNYPAQFTEITWDVRPPVILREFLTDPDWQLGRFDGSPGQYVVRPRPADGE